MGHNLNVHMDFYRLPEREVQIAKLGKRFLALEQGKIKEYHGKKLDDIKVFVEGDEVMSDSEVDETAEVVAEATVSGASPLIEMDMEDGAPLRSRRPKVSKTLPSNKKKGGKRGETDIGSREFKLRKTSQKKPWSNSEIDAVKKHLNKNIYLGKPPGKREVMTCINEEEALQSRPWTQIKDYVWNQIKKLRKEHGEDD